MMDEKIEVSGYDLAETMELNRRRRTEAEQGQGLAELPEALLPLAIALARLTARCEVAVRL